MALDSYKPGDLIINSMSILGKSIDNGFISGSIYESIFMPCVVGEFTFRDSDGSLFAGLNLSGGEPFQISIQTPGGEKINYNFLVNKPQNLQPSAGYKSRTFTLLCTSIETLTASGGVNVHGYVQKSYNNTQISANVKDVLKSYLKTNKKINIEETKGIQNIIASNEKVWPFIDRMRGRAVSSKNQSSSYVFFENRDGFNFVTIESLFKGNIIKTFVQDNTVGNDITKLTDNNIFAYELPSMFNAVDRIDKGTIKSSYNVFNFQTTEYTGNTITKPDKTDKYGGGGSWNSNSFTKMFGKYPGKAAYLLYDNKLPISNIPETVSNQLAYAGNLMQNTIKLRVFGDTKLKAGDLIDAKLAEQTSTTGNSKEDTDMAGNMIIASLRHMINPEGENPRYSCVLECLKGAPNK